MTTEHALRLVGAGVHGRRVSGPLLRDLLTALVDGLRQAVRLRVDGRSTAQGPAPAWLEHAAAFEIVDVCDGSTVLVLQASSLADAAPERFTQVELFAPIDTAGSCLDVFVASLGDALAGRRDSDRFDDHLVATLESFGRIFRHGVEAAEIVNGTTLRIDSHAIETFRQLRRETPPAQRVIVAGKLDALHHSDRVFTLVLEGGDTVRGVIGDDVDLEELGKLWGLPARVSGTAKFRPSGRLLRIEADRIDRASGDMSIWARAPTPLMGILDVRTIRRPQGPKSGVNAIIDQWPGEETEEDVRAALESLS